MRRITAGEHQLSHQDEQVLPLSRTAPPLLDLCLNQPRAPLSTLLRQATVAIAPASVALTAMIARNRVGMLTSTVSIMADIDTAGNV